MANGKDNGGGGLSLQTLLIASASSLAAAIFLHKFWQGGAILGAAFTPIIVAIVSEALRRPAQVLSARTGRNDAVNPPPVVAPEGEDRFGIWEEQRKRRPLHLKVAVATGVVAFLIAAFFLTGAELVLGGASDSDRFRFVPGKQQRKDRDRDAPARTEPGEATPAPSEDEEEEAQPTVTVTTPPEDEVAPPEEEVPPAQTAPPPGPPATAPAPQP